MKTSRKMALLLSVVMVLTAAFAAGVPAFAEEEIHILIDGEEKSFDQMPVMVNDRVLVPMRGIFEALGAEVSWDDATQTASGVKDGKTVSLAIGSTNATVNGAAVTLDVPAQLVNDRTMVPVRFISESLGTQVEWDDANQTVIVNGAVAFEVKQSFDSLTAVAENVDFAMGAEYQAQNVTLSSEQDHTTGTGKSLKLANRSVNAHRLKLMNMFSPTLTNQAYTARMWVYVPDTTTKLMIGAYGAKDTEHAILPLASKDFDVPANTWTELILTFTNTNETVTMFGIEQPVGAPLAQTIYLDDVWVQVDNSGQTGVQTPPETEATGNYYAQHGRRDVPTEFETSSELDDLIYYETSKAELPENLPAGTTLISEEDFLKSSVMGPEYGTVEQVKVEGMPFDEALRVTVNQLPQVPYAFQMKNYLKTFPADGDVVLITIYMRTISGGLKETESGQIQCIVEKNGDGNTKVVQGDVIAGKDWQVAYFPFIAKGGEFQDNIWAPVRLGYYEQTVEIGGYTMVNYGKSVDIDDLPTSLGYAYEGPNAWRDEALKRIERIRKGDMKIIVKDSAGNPVPGADVKVDMIETEFNWGTAIGTGVLGGSATNDKYMANIAKYFNSAVYETEHKWARYEQDPQLAMDMYDALVAHGVKNIRGHCLMADNSYGKGMEPGTTTLPDDVIALAGDKQALSKRIQEHFYDEVGAFKGKLTDWDVINEQASIFGTGQGRYTSILGEDAVLDWFKWAREADPDVDLYVNETNIVGVDDLQLNNYCKFIEYLIDNNVDFDGIGVEGHFGTVCNPERFYQQIDRLAQYGKHIKITEFDTNFGGERAAGFTRDIMIAAFSHESVNGFLMWGFWDGAHWLKSAPLFYQDWTMKESGKQYVDLVYNKWWTREAGTSDADGTYSLRGFYGDYEICASKDGKTKTVIATVTKGADNTIEIVLE